MQPLKTIVSSPSRIGCAPARTGRSPPAGGGPSRRSPSTHTPYPSGPRGASDSPMRSSASRSADRAPDRTPKPHTLRREVEPLAQRGGHQRLEQPRGADRRGPASPRATARPARAARRRPRCPPPYRPAPTPPRAARRRAGPRPGGGTSSPTTRRRRGSRASREPGSTRHLVRLLPARRGLAVVDRVVGDRGQVLVQRPAAGDVERLRAAADAEDRQPSGVGDPRHLELEQVQRRLHRPEVGRRRRRRRRSGRGPGRPTGRRPCSGASSEGTASARQRRQDDRARRPRARARARTACRAPSRAGAARPPGSGCVRSARRTSEVVTPTRGLLIARKATLAAPIDRIRTSGIGIV